MKKAFISELEKKTKSEKLYFSSCRNSLSDCRVLFTLVYLFKFFVQFDFQEIRGRNELNNHEEY